MSSDDEAIGFLKDSSGDWSASRLVSLLLGLAFVGMALTMIWLSYATIDLAKECVPVPQGPQCTRDPNVAAVITSIGSVVQWLGVSMGPPALAIIGVMWKRSE